MQRIVQLCINLISSIISRTRRLKPTIQYQLIAAFRRNQENWLRISFVSRSQTIDMPAKYLFEHNQALLSQFSAADAASIAATATQGAPLLVVTKTKKSTNGNGFAWLLAIQIALLFAANIMSAKVMHVLNTDIVAGALCFPLAYTTSELITEFYGLDSAKRALLMSIAANLIAMTFIQLSIYTPAADSWAGQTAYSQILQASSRGFVASILAFAAGDLLNITCFAGLKRWFSGSHLWLRLTTASLIGLVLDSLLFIFIAKGGLYPLSYLWQMTLAVCQHKIYYEIMVSSLITLGLFAFRHYQTSTVSTVSED